MATSHTAVIFERLVATEVKVQISDTLNAVIGGNSGSRPCQGSVQLGVTALLTGKQRLSQSCLFAWWIGSF